MAISKFNYVPGESEVISQVAAGIVTANQSQYFVLEGHWKFSVADIQVFYGSGKDPVPGVDYELVADDKYTGLESTFSGKQLFSKIKFTNAIYNGELFFVTGLNFGAYTDLEDTKRYIDEKVAEPLGAQEYSHNHGYGRAGTNNNPSSTDIDLPHLWYDETNVIWGFDGEGGNPDRTVRAVLAGRIVAFGVNTEFISASVDLEFGIKINGVKHGTTWTVTSTQGHLEVLLTTPIPYNAGDRIIPYLRYNLSNWNGTGLTCELYSRGGS